MKLRPRRELSSFFLKITAFSWERPHKVLPKAGLYIIRSKDDKVLGLDFVLFSKTWDDILKFSRIACCKDGTAVDDLALGKASRTGLV